MPTTKAVEEKYKKYELLEHILALPDTYIGSIEPQKINTYIYDDVTKKMVEKELTYIPGLLKIFDEVIVNAIDHSMRLKAEEGKGKDDIKHLKNIKVSINKETGYITIFNDGNGVDIKKHSSYGDLWIPELIFGELLTSTNYDKNEEKIWGGKNGYGSKLTNIFSKEFTIETVDHYTKKIFTQTFRNNMTVRDVPIVKSCSKLPYTQITFLPDYERFGMRELTNDIYDLFKRRVLDACATTSKDVTITFNSEKLSVKDFEKYCDMFLDKKEQPSVYEACGERWEVVASISDSGSFKHLSFVNGINTIKGGKHTEYITNIITKNLVDMALAKKKKVIKAQHIKDNLFIFVKALIVNPSFDSQSKETLTTPVAKFGSKCELSDKFFDKLFKQGIIDKALSLTDFYDKKKLVKTDGKKISKIIVPKLDDANLAGTKNSSECTLILTEGDSAKTMAIAGLSVIGRDRYGVFPLRGKILNVKDATLQKISDNNEITAIKKILGLEQNKKYTDVSQLRYGSIMIMTDQDHDGSHIKGLIFNIFQSMWHELYEVPGFLTSMLTPIIKASNAKGDNIEFYNMADYDKWSKTELGKRPGWKIKYYKGLGTSNDQEAKEYFKNMKKITYTYNASSDEVIDLAFNKKRADDRKDWLANYDKDNVLDYANMNVDFKTFIDKDLIHFSNRDLQRSINHLCDGLKESTRKILFACFKRKLYTNEIKVAQLSGYVSEVSAYHHGEASLQQAIVGMAQIFVGTNNINLLMPNGQHGCLDPDTDILMWDSTIQKAKNIKVGDKLVGDDGTVRNVLKTIKGTDDMYEIIMSNGESYKVNSQHILSLSFKTNKKIYYNSINQSWDVEYFDEKEMTIKNKSVNIIENGKEILTKDEGYKMIKYIVNEMNIPDVFDIKIEDFMKLPMIIQTKFRCIKNSKCINWVHQNVSTDPYILGCSIRNVTNVIPVEYILNDKETRMQLLAGIIDTYGHIKTHSGIPTIELSQNVNLNYNMILYIRFIANSLGYLTTTSTSSNKTIIHISGNNLDEIPTIKFQDKIRYRQKEKVSYEYGFSIKNLGKGSYNGWSLDGNQRFLLADFTITHNSRCQGGQDASSPRYIFTLLSKLTRLIFKEEDNNILNYLDDDGQQIEPEYYIPIIPMILVNGGLGIGTGYSTNVPQFNPSNIIDICKTICEIIKMTEIEVKNENDLEHIYDSIDALEIEELTPYYLGFKGSVEKTDKNTYISKGSYKWIDDETVEITELPVGTWTEDYKELLENMITNNQNNLKYFENHYTSKNVKFILHFNANSRTTLQDKFETIFKLTSSKNLGINNMHLFNEKCTIQKYDTTTDIIKSWAEVRIRKYYERKIYQISILMKEHNILSAKIRFIIDVIEGKIQIMNKKLIDIAKRLVELEYPRIQKDSVDDEEQDSDIRDFQYLLKMPISQLTYDRKIILEKEVTELNDKLNNLKNTKIEDMWLSDLDVLEKAWNEHKEQIIAEYDNDRLGIVATKTKKKGKKM
jgi:DNA gyrase/topoisomerase IV subunit B